MMLFSSFCLLKLEFIVFVQLLKHIVNEEI